MSKALTQEELLIDNLNYYSVDPRARRCTKGTNCAYSPITIGKNTSEGCGIGRHLDPDDAYNIDELHKEIDIEDLIESEREKIPYWMFKMDIGYLTNIQYLHDFDHHWGDRGLTESGVRFVLQLIMTHNLEIDPLEINKYKNFSNAYTTSSL